MVIVFHQIRSFEKFLLFVTFVHNLIVKTRRRKVDQFAALRSRRSRAMQILSPTIVTSSFVRLNFDRESSVSLAEKIDRWKCRREASPFLPVLVSIEARNLINSSCTRRRTRRFLSARNCLLPFYVVPAICRDSARCEFDRSTSRSDFPILKRFVRERESTGNGENCEPCCNSLV